MRYPAFLQKFSMRKGKEINTLKMYPTKDIILPYNSCLHYIDLDPAALGIPGNHPLIINHRGDIRVHHEHDLDITVGTGLKKQVKYSKLETFYFKQQSRVKRAKDLEKILGVSRSLLVYDYSLLAKGFEYNTHVQATFYEWSNIRDAVIKGMNRVGDVRNNFILINLPRKLPEWEDFNKIKDSMSNEEAGRWHTSEALNLRELWLFIEGKGKYITLDPKTIESTTVILKDGSNSFVVRLEELMPEIDEEGEVTKIDEQTKRHFVGLIKKFSEVRSVAEIENKEEEIVNPDDEIYVSVTPQMDNQIRELGSVGLLSAAEQKRLRSMAEKTADIPDPFGSGKTISAIESDDAVKTSLSTAKPNAIKNIVNPELINSSIDNFDKEYMEKLYEQDLVNMIGSMKQAGYIMTDFTREETKTVQDHYDDFAVRIQPITGKPSVFKFRIPKISDDGKYMLGGSTYNIEPQRVDMPIRKAGPDKVALTSYYGKTFIARSPKAVDNYTRWILRNVRERGLDAKDKSIVDLHFGKSKKIEGDIPLLYTGIAESMKGFKSDKYVFNFDYFAREEKYGKAALVEHEKGGRVICGRFGQAYLVIDKFNDFYHVGTRAGEVKLGRFEGFILDGKTAPKDHCTVNIFGKKIPVVIAISYLMGFEKMLKSMKIKYRTVPFGTRATLESNEIAIPFKDDMVIVDATEPKVSMLFAGWRTVAKYTKLYRLDQLNKKSGYAGISDPLKANAYHWRELELMNDMFVDPITKEILEGIDEPTEFIQLLIRANELLLNNDYPAETDIAYMRIRGLERVSGIVYRRMIEGMRAHRNNPVSRSANVDINPNAVLMGMIGDTATQTSSMINPIENLKEAEALTLAGEGGRSAVSLVKKSRVFHPGDLGVISEATPDSSKVAIRTFMTPDANITDLRGTAGKWNKKQSNNKVLSTTALLMPGSNHDD